MLHLGKVVISRLRLILYLYLSICLVSVGHLCLIALWVCYVLWLMLSCEVKCNF